MTMTVEEGTIMPNEEGKADEETKKPIIINLDYIEGLRQARKKDELIALMDKPRTVPFELWGVIAAALLTLSSEQSQQESQSNVAASAAEQMPSVEVPTISTPIPTPSQIDEYLSRKVKAVPLPTMCNRDETFAPLILDGASGVGKTQQAFALLRDGSKLIYLNLSDVMDAAQKIYFEMGQLVDLQRIKLLLGKAFHELKSFEINKEEGEEDDENDAFSSQRLKTSLDICFVDPYPLEGLRNLVLALQQN